MTNIYLPFISLAIHGADFMLRSIAKNTLRNY